MAGFDVITEDAALSVGGSVAASVFPQPVCIYTVFAISNYTGEEFHRNWQQVTESRRREERRYAKRVGASCAWAQFREAGVRIGSDFALIFRSSSNTDPKRPARFRPALQELIAKCRPELLLSPLGIGDHWDHFLVREAVLEMNTKARPPVLFYEDLPYAYHLGPKSVERFVASFNHRLRPILISIDWEIKRAGLKCYPSQLDDHHACRVENYALRLAERVKENGPLERLWTTASASLLTNRKSLLFPPAIL